MTEREARIHELEAKAAEVTLLAHLAGQPATRLFNAGLAADLLELIQLLRAGEATRLGASSAAAPL